MVIAENIFGPDVGSLKGKTVCNSPATVDMPTSIVPETIMLHSQVTLGGDIMFVNRIPFFVTISRHIYFGTVEAINNQQKSTLLQSIAQVKHTYLQRGFQIWMANLNIFVGTLLQTYRSP